MRVRCNFIGWNVEETIAMTIRHYQSFCSEVVFWDNYSTDSSEWIAQTMGAKVRQFGFRGVLDDQEYIKVKNSCWKGSDFDWEIVLDDDEILWHPKLSFILEQEKACGTTIFKTQGYGMYSNEMPNGTFLETNTGIQDDKYSKLVIFDPKKVREIGYIYGAHEAKPLGDLQWSHTTLPLYHYMAVGGAERMIKRHQLYASRLSDFNRRWGCGIEYTYSAESKRQWFDEQLKKSGPLFEVGAF